MKWFRNGFLVLYAILIMFACGCPNPDAAITPEDPVETNDPPEAPHTPYPEDHAVDQSTRPILFWRCEDDPDGDPLTFTIYLTRYFDSYEHDPIVVPDTMYAMLVDLEKNRRYDWHVEAEDGSNPAVASDVWTFYTGESTNNPPFPPFNPDPPDFATDVQAEDVTLRWEGYDPDGDPLVYDVWFEHYLVGGDTIVKYHPDSYYNVGRLGASVEWRWFVVVRDDQGGVTSNFANEWRFETEETNEPPVTPYNPTPDDDEIGVATDAMLHWQCSDPNGDPLTYDVWLGPPLSPILVSADQSTTTYQPSSLLKDMEYEWWIVARDDEGAETLGPIWSFTTADEVFAELQVLRSITNDYGFLIVGDIIKARFDGAYAPDLGIYPLRPDEVLVFSDPDQFDLFWLDYEQIYIYRDPENDPFITLGNTYRFRVYPGPGIVNALEYDVIMPDCEAYFTSPENNTPVSLDGFEVQWTSSCPGTGLVYFSFRNDYGEDLGINVQTDNDGSHTFSQEILAPAAGSAMIFIDMIEENTGNITAVGYHPESVYRARVSSMLMLYPM